VCTADTTRGLKGSQIQMNKKNNRYGVLCAVNDKYALKTSSARIKQILKIIRAKNTSSLQIFISLTVAVLPSSLHLCHGKVRKQKAHSSSTMIAFGLKRGN
jgi:hypothetical protein